MFEKLNQFTKKVSDLADKPALNPSELKAFFDAAPEELRNYFNNLIDALISAESGNSGAKNIGATTISGLSGSDVQSLLESLKTVHDERISSIETNPFFYYRSADILKIDHSDTLFLLGVTDPLSAGITIESNYIVFPTAGKYVLEGVADFSGLSNLETAEILIRLTYPNGTYKDDSHLVTGFTGLGGNVSAGGIPVYHSRVLDIPAGGKIRFYARCSEAPRNINNFWIKGWRISY